MTSYYIPRNPKDSPMIFNREPALILAAVQAVLAVAIGFGVDITTEQLALILAATAAVLGLVTRSKVTPV
jgi:hypothetical protein